MRKQPLEKTYWKDIHAMKDKLEWIKAYSQLDRNEARHIPLTSAQSTSLEDAIFHLDRFLNPV